MDESVKEFLFDLGLEEYHEIFVTKGFNSESDMGNIEEDDLNSMGITSPTHRQLLLTAAFHYTPSEEHKLYKWLREHQLDYYYINFVRSELTDFAELEKMNLPDETIYDELEIMLPGHKKRLEKAVHKLRLQRRTSVNPEEPLAVGKWGKPAALIDAKYDFLCVDAVITSTKTRGNSTRMDFMVDSGSDVVTLREEILEGLDLELLGTVRSKGVHASKEKRLYKAHLSIGHFTIEIEVMPESYDSLGSRVIRHFRHFIDGNRHVWLPGNLSESVTPTNETLPVQNIERSNLETLQTTSVTCDTDTAGATKSKQYLEDESTKADQYELEMNSTLLSSTEAVINESSSAAFPLASIFKESGKYLTDTSVLKPKPCESRPAGIGLARDSQLPSPVTKHYRSDSVIDPMEEEYNNDKRKHPPTIKVEQSDSSPFKRPKASGSLAERHPSIVKETTDSTPGESGSYMVKANQSDIDAEETNSTITENSDICIPGSDSNKFKTEQSGLIPQENFVRRKQKDSDKREIQLNALATEKMGSNITGDDQTIERSEKPGSSQDTTNTSTSTLKGPHDSEKCLKSSNESSTVQILSRFCGTPSMNSCRHSPVNSAEHLSHRLPQINSAEKCKQLPKVWNTAAECTPDGTPFSTTEPRNTDLSKLSNIVHGLTPIKSANLCTGTNFRKRKLFDTSKVGLSTLSSDSKLASYSADDTCQSTNSLTSSTHSVTSLANFTLSSAAGVSPPKINCLATRNRPEMSWDSRYTIIYSPSCSKLPNNSHPNADNTATVASSAFISNSLPFKENSTFFENELYSSKCCHMSLCVEKRVSLVTGEKSV